MPAHTSTHTCVRTHVYAYVCTYTSAHTCLRTHDYAHVFSNCTLTARELFPEVAITDGLLAPSPPTSAAAGWFFHFAATSKQRVQQPLRYLNDSYVDIMADMYVAGNRPALAGLFVWYRRVPTRHCRAQWVGYTSMDH